MTAQFLKKRPLGARCGPRRGLAEGRCSALRVRARQQVRSAAQCESSAAAGAEVWSKAVRVQKRSEGRRGVREMERGKWKRCVSNCHFNHLLGIKGLGEER